MPDYEIKFHPSFFDDLKKLDKFYLGLLHKWYKRIKEDPLQQRRLTSTNNCFKVRIEKLRVIYYVEHNEIWFLIARKRDDVYEDYIKRLHSLNTRFKN